MSCKFQQFKAFISILSTERLPILLRGNDAQRAGLLPVPSLQSLLLHPLPAESALSPLAGPVPTCRADKPEGYARHGMPGGMHVQLFLKYGAKIGLLEKLF
jgi:hypothetical protein